MKDFSFEKKAGEIRTFGVQIMDACNDADSIVLSSVDATAANEDGTDATSTVILQDGYDGDVASFKASGATPAGKSYTITLTATANDGQKYIAKGILRTT